MFHNESLFPKSQLASMGSEDPFVYIDRSGTFHSVWHNMDPCPDYPCPEVAGGHAFSTDGITWSYTGTAYGSTGSYVDEHLYNIQCSEICIHLRNEKFHTET